MDTGPQFESEDERAKAAAESMLRDLKEFRLHVRKIGTVRVALEHNPAWYKELCSAYSRPKPRKVRTIIKRDHVIRVLKTILAGRPNPGLIYYQRLEPFVQDYNFERCGF